jgi:hypothetical protein
VENGQQWEPREAKGHVGNGSKSGSKGRYDLMMKFVSLRIESGHCIHLHFCSDHIQIAERENMWRCPSQEAQEAGDRYRAQEEEP